MSHTPNPAHSIETPNDVREQFQAFIERLHDQGEDTDPFRALFTPRARGELLHQLLSLTEPRTAAEICDQFHISRSTFGNHIDTLVAAGVITDAGKRGNATTYQPNRDHPVTQLLTMAETVQRYGVTPDLLDDQFIGQPADLDTEQNHEEDR